MNDGVRFPFAAVIKVTTIPFTVSEPLFVSVATFNLFLLCMVPFSSNPLPANIYANMCCVGRKG